MNISLQIPALGMTFSLPVPLLVVVVAIIIGLALLGHRGRRRRRQTGRTRHPVRAGRTQLRKPDHGARIARLHGHMRSPEWARVAKEHRLREPACVACGYRGKGLQVHHIKPFHLHPHLELDPRNLITLCEVRGRNHHLLLGHLDEWESYNEHVQNDSRHFYGKTAAQIQADLIWQKKVKLRP